MSQPRGWAGGEWNPRKTFAAGWVELAERYGTDPRSLRIDLSWVDGLTPAGVDRLLRELEDRLRDEAAQQG